MLVPIYNFDVRDFVKSLSEQSTKLDAHVEILCLDDASDALYRQVNSEISSLPNVTYQESEHNLGRSIVRNRLVEEAQYDNLIFLDCDGKCLNDQYLEIYLDLVPNYEVIFGGRVYNDEAPDDHDFYFHWYCGSNREAILLEHRVPQPYKTFMTNNFMIRKSVYNQVKMDETLSGYGHEDTLFAIQLRKAGFTINHIDNAIEHIGLEPWAIFLEKSRNGVRNLAQLITQKKVDSSIRLVRYHALVKRFGLSPLVSVIVKWFEPQIFKNLRGPAPNLVWFDLWKLAELQRKTPD